MSRKKRTSHTRTVLPHDCWIGKMSVHPQNWQSSRAPLSADWYIFYRFHDPRYVSEYPKGKLVIAHGSINSYPLLEERQDAVDVLKSYELHSLKNEGFNPITKISTPPEVHEYEVSPDTPFHEALKKAWSRLKISDRMKAEIRCQVVLFEKAILIKQYGHMAIKDVRRRHIVYVLDEIGKLKKQSWTNNNYNVYRKHLQMLFKELLIIEAVEANYVENIPRRKTIKKKRRTLTDEERKRINKHLAANYYEFWRFTHIFFHSSARETEMTRVKYEDVDLKRQRFKVTVLKGKSFNEEYRVIKDIIKPLWEDTMRQAKPGDYLFSKSLKPGQKQIRADQITKRWHRLVKKGLGIEADFYSLKHSNLDEIAEALSLAAAQEAAGHSTPVITMDYAVGERERNLKKQQKVRNKFA